MTKSESIANIAAALCKAMAKIANPPLDKVLKTDKFTHRYSSLAAVLEVIRPAFAAEGLHPLPCPSTGQRGPAVSILLMHTSGEWVLTDPVEVPSQPTAHGYGSALTYALRYTLSAVGGVVGEDDDDAQGAMRPPARPKEKQAGVYEGILATEQALVGRGLCEQGELRKHLAETLSAWIDGDIMDWPAAVAPMVTRAKKEFAEDKKREKAAQQGGPRAA